MQTIKNIIAQENYKEDCDNIQYPILNTSIANNNIN
jgi:hypothetical protein